MLVRRSRPGRAALQQLDVVEDLAAPILDHPLAADLALEPVVERGLEPFLPAVVDVGEADDVPGDLAGRIVAAVLAHRADARQAEVEDLLCHGRRHVPLQVHELAFEIARDAPREPLVVLIEQRRELAEPIERGFELLRIGVDRVDRRADGERLAVAIRQRAAMRGDLHRAQVAIVGLLGEEILVDELQIKDPPFESGGAEREADEQQRAAPARAFGHGRLRRRVSSCQRVGSRTTTSWSSLGSVSCRRCAGERLDARVRRLSALLDLQPAPLDLQLVELAVQLLGLDEQLPRVMLDVDDPNARRHDARGERSTPTSSRISFALLMRLARAARARRRAAARCAHAGCARAPRRRGARACRRA